MKFDTDTSTLTEIHGKNASEKAQNNVTLKEKKLPLQQDFMPISAL